MLLEDCSKIRDDVREFFKLGNKSSNKRYFVNHDGSTNLNTIRILRMQRKKKALERAERRELGSLRSRDYRVKDDEYGSPEQLVEILFEMPVTDRSGNCHEMAVMSAYKVVKGNHALPESVYYGMITKPGDHAFCLVRQGRGFLDQYSSVSEFTNAAWSSSWFVIDPWLNIVCTADQYLFYAHVMLGKWALEGKRVKWAHGSQGIGWYPAIGEYREKFKDAPLELISLRRQE